MVPGVGLSCEAGLKYNQRVFGHSRDVHGTLCTRGHVLPGHVAWQGFQLDKIDDCFSSPGAFIAHSAIMKGSQ